MKIEFSAKDIAKMYEEYDAIDEILNRYNCGSGTAYATALGIKVEAFDYSYGRKLNLEIKENLMKDFEMMIRNTLKTRQIDITNIFQTLGLKLA